MNPTTLLIFAVTLLIAVVVSTHARRSVLSMAVLFLAAGFVAGKGWFGWIEVEASDPIVKQMAQITLFVVLFTDGMRTGVRELLAAWNLPGRALILGMPIVAVGNAALAHWLVGLNWTASLLIGTALAPTDPVFASAIVGREHVPLKLRHLLNIESGLNDGMTLPVVIALLAVASAEPPHVGMLLAEVVSGIFVGISVAYVALKIEESWLFGISPSRQPLAIFSIGLLVYAISEVTHSLGFPINSFLAAFFAGITVKSVSPQMRDSFQELGVIIADIFKFASLLLLGALISSEFIWNASLAEWLFVIGALLLVRPLALSLSLLGSELGWRERLVAAWFGPKGFASVVYAILILQSDLSDKNAIFHLAALTIAASMIAHSSTDVLVASWLDANQEEPIPSDEQEPT